MISESDQEKIKKLKEIEEIHLSYIKDIAELKSERDFWRGAAIFIFVFSTMVIIYLRFGG